MKTAGACAAVVVVVVMMMMMVVLSEADTAKAATCSPIEMNACIPAISAAAPPSSMCCRKVREQRPCLCGYLKDPNLRQYINSPNARKTASSCGVHFPNC